MVFTTTNEGVLTTQSICKMLHIACNGCFSWVLFIKTFLPNLPGMVGELFVNMLNIDITMVPEHRFADALSLV